MQQDGNTTGLKELSKAIPAVKPIVEKAFAGARR